MNPIDNIVYVPCHLIMNQDINPNKTTTKELNSIQISLFNIGFVSPIPIIYNPNFVKEIDENLMLENSLFANPDSGGGKFSSSSNCIKDKTVYPYMVIDGAQRTSIIKLGTYYFKNNRDYYLKKWKSKTPEEPGKEMMAYLAYINNFSIPCCIIENVKKEYLISSTFLLNTSHGNHDFSIVKDIINNIDIDNDWISKNLFLDKDSVDMITREKEVKYEDNNCWSFENDPQYKELKDFYVMREAYYYLENYIEEHAEDIKKANVRTISDIKNLF